MRRLQKQGHRTGDKRFCPLQTRVHAIGHLSANHEPTRFEHQRQESDEPSIIDKQSRVQQEDRQSQAELEYESIGCTCGNFPDLEGITRHLIQVLRETSKPDLRYFKNYIDKFDDPDDLCIALLDCVDPKIRGLEDKAVTPGLLENIRCQKADGEIFDGIGGYFDSLTDDREDNYCRLYVEQSTNVRSRSRGHVVPLLSDSVEPLHYYIYALSKCSRKSHFLQLFRFPTTKIHRIGTLFNTRHARDDHGAGIQVTSGGTFSRILPQLQAPSQKTNGTLECIMSFRTRSLAEQGQERWWSGEIAKILRPRDTKLAEFSEQAGRPDCLKTLRGTFF